MHLVIICKAVEITISPLWVVGDIRSTTCLYPRTLLHATTIIIVFCHNVRSTRYIYIAQYFGWLLLYVSNKPCLLDANPYIINFTPHICVYIAASASVIFDRSKITLYWFAALAAG